MNLEDKLPVFDLINCVFAFNIAKGELLRFLDLYSNVSKITQGEYYPGSIPIKCFTLRIWTVLCVFKSLLEKTHKFLSIHQDCDYF